MTSQPYQQEFDNLAKRGYRLKLVNGHAIGSSARSAAIWEAQQRTGTAVMSERVNRAGVSERARPDATRLQLSNTAATAMTSARRLGA